MTPAPLTPRSKIIAVTPFRRRARRLERKLQAQLEVGWATDARMPGWALGVKVAPAGRLLWAVIATEHRGH